VPCSQSRAARPSESLAAAQDQYEVTRTTLENMKMPEKNDSQSAPWPVATLVTLIVALIGAFATIYSQGGFRGRRDEGVNESLKALHEAEVKAAVSASRIAADEAFTKLDPEPLKKYYCDYALAGNVDAIRRLKEQGAESLEVSTLTISQDAIDIFDRPLHARVRETITRTITVYQANTCYRTRPFESKLTLYLKHTEDNAWRIYSVDEKRDGLSYVPCS
jgi:hypothetical protein